MEDLYQSQQWGHLAVKYFNTLISKLKKAAKSKKAMYALSSVCFLEPIILPLFPEIILTPILLSKPDEKVKILLLALFMTLLGSTIAYSMSYFFGNIILNALSHLISDLELIISNMSSYGTLLPLLGSLTPMPFKVVCLSSGILKIPYTKFISGILLGRGVRYGLLLLIPQKKATANIPNQPIL